MQLSSLSNSELELSFERAVVSERKITHLVVMHVQEVHRRGLHLQEAYGSMAKYLIKKMGYSAPAAYRRIDAARLSNAVPSVAEKIQSGEINLTQIGEIQRAVKNAEKVHQEKITKEVKAELVDLVLNHSTSETQQL